MNDSLVLKNKRKIGIFFKKWKTPREGICAGAVELMFAKECDAYGYAGRFGVKIVHADEEGVPGVGDVGFVFVGIFGRIGELFR